MNDLKPCPFCGKTPIYYYGDVGSDSALYRHEIYCARSECLVEVRVSYSSKEEAIEAWNRRVDDDVSL